MLEPWSNPWEHTASLMAQTHNMNCKEAKEIRDFLPGLLHEKDPLSEQEIERRIMAKLGIK